MFISESDLKRIEDLSEANLALQAYEASKAFGPFEQWEGTAALLEAAQVSYGVGAPDRSWRLTSRAWHRDQSDPHAIFHFAIGVLQRRGPLMALLYIRRYPDLRAEDLLMSWWYSLQAQLYAMLRDFSEALRFHKLAAAACPSEAWVWTARSYALEQQDRYEEALEMARKSVELAPTRRSSVSSLAHYLTLLEKNDEALQLLSSVVEKVENGWMLKELADLQSELGMYDAAYKTHLQTIEYLPLIETKVGEWIYGGISDAAYLAGDQDNAKVLAEKSAAPFYKKVLENLNSSTPEANRVLLDVKFLRQHQVTCAPATLSNIGRYWNKKAEHLELVEQMCYDGTPSYKERIWAESNGWVTREFTLNWKDATALLDRGIPLTLATVYPGGGHLQAIIGYDERRGTYLVRDPYYPKTAEFLADELLKDQKANGPRVMALVPKESEHLFLDIGETLFERELYDLFFEMESELEKHERTAAGEALKLLEEKFPNHRISLVARWTISAYDGQTSGIRAALSELLKLYPDDVNLRLSDVGVSSELTSRLDRIATLEKYSMTKPTDPLLWQMFGYELGIDSNQQPRALHWLAKSLRKAPGNPLTFRFIADILWSQRRFQEGAQLYRFATLMNDKDENFAYSYFLAMRYLKREDEAVEILSDRFERFGKRSGLPVRSLFSALRELGRVDEAFTVLVRAIEMRPDDGDLMLFAADANARYGRAEQADQLVDRAKGKSPTARWLRASAWIDYLQGKSDEALSKWRTVLADDPLATDAHESVANLMKSSEGSAATKEYLRKLCRKFPTNRNFQILRLQHLDQEPGEAIAVLRDLIRADPADVWSMRELAYWYEQVGKFDRALQTAEQALAADPNDGVSHWFRGRALELLQRNTEAAEEYRLSVKFSLDYTRAITSWIGIARTVDERRRVLEAVWLELNSQASTGEGLLTFRDEALRILDGEKLLADLEDFASSNRNAWFAESAVIQQLVDMGRDDEAAKRAIEATQRFPLVYQTWLDLALVHRLAGNVDEEISSLRTAISINPVSSYPVQMLAEAYQRTGKLTDAREVLLNALTRMPFDNFLVGYLAEVHWLLGEQRTAIEVATRAITIDPAYRWAWMAIKRWAEEIGDNELPVKLARELAEKKPKDIRTWINLADMLSTVGKFSQDELDAIEHALSLDPYSSNALAMKAGVLSDARRFDEAIGIARTTTPDGYRTEQLQFVEAGIEATRGNNDRSIEILEELTRTSPGYLPGWSRLADVYATDDRHSKDYKRVTQEMVRLAPREATAFGYFADACRKLGEKNEAREALEQAIILDRSYQYAVTNLFDLYIESKDYAAAEKLVETIVPAAPSVGLPFAVELAAYKRDKDKARSWLEKVLVDSGVTSDRLNRMFEKYGDSFGFDSSVTDLLVKICSEGEAVPVVGRFVIHSLFQSRRGQCEEFLRSIESKSELWAEAASRYTELLFEYDHDMLRRFIDSNYERLGSYNVTWSAVGYQLSNLNDVDRASRWFARWEDRKDVRPWMLWNYAIVLRRAKRTTEAAKVSSGALSLESDDTVNSHLTLLALDEFSTGRISDAAAIYSDINPSALTEWERFFYDVLTLGLEADSSLAQGNVKKAKADIQEIVTRMIASDPKAMDRMIRETAMAVVNVLLPKVGIPWFTFLVKARRFLNY